MPDENVFNELERREVDVMEIALMAKSQRTAITLQEFIQTRLINGSSLESIRGTLLTDLEQGGRIFGEFRRAITATAKGSVNRVRDIGQYSEHGIITKYRWSAVLVNTCPDCLGNHGKVMPWDGWEGSTFGLPRSGGTVCRENCRCVLLPEETTELEPIKRVKK